MLNSPVSHLLVIGVLTTGIALHASEVVKCPATASACISSVDGERDGNLGNCPRIKLKGYQEFGLLDFDVAALKGKKISAASLHIAPAEGCRFAKARGTDLRWFTISTVSTPWEEANAANPQEKVRTGVTFNEASIGKTGWAYPGAKIWDVILGNGNSLRCDIDGGDPKNGWFSIPLDTRLVEAMVAGASHGLVLMDASVFTSGNAFIYSKHTDKPPYLEVTVEGADAQIPAPPSNFTIEPSPQDTDTRTGALKLSLTVPPGVFAYDVKLNGQPVPRWQIPFSGKPGSRQEFVIEYLEAGKEVKAEISTVSAAGVVSPAADATGKVSPSVSVPKVYRSDWEPHGGNAPKAGENLKVWAFPEISKLDPLTGKIVLETGMDKAESLNSVWDAASGSIRVVAARGEIAGFQLALERLGEPLSDIKITAEGLDNIKANCFRTWFVQVKETWQAEYALPLKPGEALSIPAPDNAIPQQKAAVVAVDLIVPAEARPGVQSGFVKITTGGQTVSLPLKLQIFAATIPNETHFVPELNCYDGPLDAAGTEKFFNSFRVAHYYRCNINRVPYHHNGRTDADWTPQIDAAGHVTNWAAFDKNLGPLLDGSAFKDCPRAGVPVPALFLPFNESWPLAFGTHYHPGENVPLEGKDWKPLHDLYAKTPEESFDQQYKDAFVTCVQDFVEHFEKKGWSQTAMEAFFNNKAQHGSKSTTGSDGKPAHIPAMTGTAWTMDEPRTWLDWQALIFYSKLFHKGIAGAKTAKFVFRGDISRPMWQGNCMDGYMEVMDAGGVAFSMLPLMKSAMQRMPAKVTCYAGCNTQDKANNQTFCLVLKAYLSGFDGTGPWQSVGGDDAFLKGDFVGKGGAADRGNLLIVDGSKRFGVDAIASFRLQAFRSGAQIAELLRLLEAKNGWSRTSSQALVSQFIPLDAEFKQTSADDAAVLRFGAVNGDELVHLKEAILKLLEQ